MIAKLKVNGRFLDLSKTVSISLIRTLSFFSFGLISRSRSLPFRFPASDLNRQITGFFDMVEASNASHFIDDCELYIFDNFYEKGRLKFSYSNKMFTGTLLLELSSKAEDFKKTKFSELDLGKFDIFVARFRLEHPLLNDLSNDPYNWGNSDNVTIVLRYVDPDDTIHIYTQSGPLFNIEILYRQLLIDFNNEQPHVAFINPGNFSGGGFGTGQEIIIDVKELPKFISIRVYSNQNSRDFNETFTQDSNYTGSLGDTLTNVFKTICFPVIYAPDFFQDQPTDFTGFLNEYDRVNQVYTGKFLVPCFFLKYLLQTMASNLGILLKGDFMENTDFDDLIVFQNKELDATNGNDFNEMTPDISFAELLKQMSLQLCLYIIYDIDLQILYIHTKKSLLEQTKYFDKNSITFISL